MVVAVKERAVGGHVIEHAIQHDAYAKLVGMLDQIIPILLRAKVGIDLLIVLRIVGMVGTGVEDRVEVNGIDTQRLR